jgi:sugar lactone lactonase YvrE
MAVRESPVVPDPDALIREARRRQHRRWAAIAALVGGLAVSVAVTAGFIGRHHIRQRTTTHAPSSHRLAPAVPQPSGPQPKQPGSLAIGPDGGLYIADYVRNQILELRDGRFRVAVGNGRVGFGGDDGPATKAEINQPEGMTFRNGTLYFADSGNGRIRAVSPSGVITTVAGDGQPTRAPWVADGTPAMTTPLNPSALTFGPDGHMYVAADPQVLRLATDGSFTRVLGTASFHQGVYGIGGPAVDGSADGPDGLAFDSAGDLYVFGSNTKALLMIDRHGTLRLVSGNFYPRGHGGLVTAPDGTVIAMESEGMVRLSPHSTQSLVAFPSYDRAFHGIRNFQPNGIAVTPNGTIYVDTFWGNGYSQQVSDRNNRQGRALLPRLGTEPAIVRPLADERQLRSSEP